LNGKTAAIALYYEKESCFRALNCEKVCRQGQEMCEDCNEVYKRVRTKISHGGSQLSPFTPSEKIVGVKLLQRAVKQLRQEINQKKKLIAAVEFRPTETLQVILERERERERERD